MKDNKRFTLNQTDCLTINTQQCMETAYKLRGEALSGHIGILKNVFKRKSAATKLKK